MSKEIHFYPYGCETAFADWMSTDAALTDGYDYIETTQMGLLSADLWFMDYRIFIHEFDDEVYELKLGSDNERTDKELRREHNLFKLWQAGEFDLY